MKKKNLIFALSVIILAEVICIAGLCICRGNDKIEPEISVRELPSQTVLYTIYRGYDYKINNAIEQLYSLAKNKGFVPCGPVLTSCLNSSSYETPEHRLFEIQIPVDSNALEQTGTLGDMTDIKIRPAMKIASIIKSEVNNDTTVIIQNLFSWISRHGYIVKGKMLQLTSGTENGDYSNNLQIEFAVPIDKFTDNTKLTLHLDPYYM